MDQKEKNRISIFDEWTSFSAAAASVAEIAANENELLNGDVNTRLPDLWTWQESYARKLVGFICLTTRYTRLSSWLTMFAILRIDDKRMAKMVRFKVAGRKSVRSIFLRPKRTFLPFIVIGFSHPPAGTSLVRITAARFMATDSFVCRIFAQQAKINQLTVTHVFLMWSMKYEPQLWGHSALRIWT